MTAARTRSAGTLSLLPPRSAEPVSQYVSFTLGSQSFGVPVAVVQEVVPPQPLSRTPLGRAEIAGLLNLRGQIVTAIDLRTRLGLPRLDRGSSLNVVVLHQGNPYSLLVDEVSDVVDVPAANVKPVPVTLHRRWQESLTGIFAGPDRLMLLIDVGAVLDLGRG